MRELNAVDIELISGGEADFSGVTATVDSTEEPARGAVYNALYDFVKGAAKGWL